MQRLEYITSNERAFILQGLQEQCRVDGRQLFAGRQPVFQFSLDDSSVQVSMGKTRVLAAIEGSLEGPYPDRPAEGSIRFNVEFSPMASASFEPGRPGEDAIQVARLVERSIKQSHALDMEALCVLAGRKVWALSVNVHVVDHDGNLLDASCLAALAALLVYRKPEVVLAGDTGTDVVIQPPEVHEPLSLTLHHLPVAVTFAMFQDGDTIVVDPSLAEEAAASGSCTFVINNSGEVCCVHKAEGAGLTSSQLLRCMRLAGAKAKELIAALNAALKEHEVARVKARVRHRHVGGIAQAPRPASAQQPAQQQQQDLDDLDADLLHSDTASSSDEEDTAIEDAKPSASAERQQQQPRQGNVKPEQRARTKREDAGEGGKPGPRQANSIAPAEQQQQQRQPSSSQLGKRLNDTLSFESLAATAAVVAGVGDGDGSAAEVKLEDAVKVSSAKKGAKKAKQK